MWCNKNSTCDLSKKKRIQLVKWDIRRRPMEKENIYWQQIKIIRTGNVSWSKRGTCEIVIAAFRNPLDRVIVMLVHAAPWSTHVVTCVGCICISRSTNSLFIYLKRVFIYVKLIRQLVIGRVLASYETNPINGIATIILHSNLFYAVRICLDQKLEICNPLWYIIYHERKRISVWIFYNYAQWIKVRGLNIYTQKKVWGGEWNTKTRVESNVTNLIASLFCNYIGNSSNNFSANKL